MTQPTHPRLDVRTRLAELAELAPGWLGNGEGAALDPAGLTTLAESLARASDDGMPSPYLYPTVAGGAQAEWSFGDWEVQCEFDLASQRGECLAMNARLRTERRATVELSQADGPKSLAEFVMRCAGR